MGMGLFKAGPPHGAVGNVVFSSCQWRGCKVVDPCEGPVMVVCQFLCKENVQSKADSQCVQRSP